MKTKCKNCGGKLIFAPKFKSNTCESCGTNYPIPYEHDFVKKEFGDLVDVKQEKNANLQQIKCSSCGGEVVISSLQILAKCPYCGSTAIEETKKAKIMHADSIIPFTMDKKEALETFKTDLAGRVFANKNLFRGINEDDLIGIYINTFIFDFDTNTHYKGILSYQESRREKDGTIKHETIFVKVNHNINYFVSNLAIEANSQINQLDLDTVMPFKYESAVNFKEDFLNGHMVEYQNAMFSDCVNSAKNKVNLMIEKEILKKHNCTKIVSLEKDIGYISSKFNYCLLPLYFLNVNDPKKGNIRVLINGQTGKTGKIPADIGKILKLVLSICGGVVAFIILVLVFAFYVMK